VANLFPFSIHHSPFSIQYSVFIERQMDGALVIDKPSGLTSHDVVGRVRRAVGISRIGHTGTLDPLATGVLPLLVGRATRLAPLLSGGLKRYDGLIRLGLETDTYDITGRVIAREGLVSGDPRAGGERGARLSTAAEAVDVDASGLDAARAAFVGTFRQQPPPFSAKKVGGVRAYRLARRRQPVRLDPVEVTVHDLTLTPAGPGRVRCRLTCSSGFYVRSLAHDLGQRLGTGGCLEALRREWSDGFGLAQAVPLELVDAEGPVALARLIVLADLLPDLPALVLTARGAARVAHGCDLTPADVVPAAAADAARPLHIKLLDARGTLLAIAERRPDRFLHPAIVLV